MSSTATEYDTSMESKPVCRECPDPCCYAASWQWHLPPVTSEDIRQIRERSGQDDFLAEADGFKVLRVADDGCCTFMDRTTHECTIYPVRPYDCRAFPFDFFPLNENESMWVMWDCLLSRSIPPDEIEPRLTWLETHYADQIRTIWHYGNDDYLTPSAQRSPEHKQFRVLRKVRLLLKEAPP